MSPTRLRGNVLSLWGLCYFQNVSKYRRDKQTKGDDFIFSGRETFNQWLRVFSEYSAALWLWHGSPWSSLCRQQSWTCWCHKYHLALKTWPANVGCHSPFFILQPKCLEDSWPLPMKCFSYLPSLLYLPLLSFRATRLFCTCRFVWLLFLINLPHRPCLAKFFP